MLHFLVFESKCIEFRMQHNYVHEASLQCHIKTRMMAVVITVNRRWDWAHECLRNYWDPVCHCTLGRPGCFGAVCLQKPAFNIWTVSHQGKHISPTYQY
jgi:hypothetical protein